MAAALIQAIRSRWASAGCLAVIAAAYLLPESGLGLPVCQFKNMTHLPCLGCGLTRSFIGMAHLDVARAGFYHPTGVLLFPLLLFFAALLPVPAGARERLAAWAEGRRGWLNGLSIAAVAFFLVYGFGRIAWILMSGKPSPW